MAQSFAAAAETGALALAGAGRAGGGVLKAGGGWGLALGTPPLA
jgi:hypothetical protein